MKRAFGLARLPLAVLASVFALAVGGAQAEAEMRIQQSLVRALSAEREALRQIEPAAHLGLPAPEAPHEARYDQAWLLSRAWPSRTGAEFSCLKEAIYHESRGEDIVGQFAVAEVILNRVDSPAYPDTICGVVHQNAHMRNACQFSYACNGRSRAMVDRRARTIAAQIADILMSGAERELTGGATHFHTVQVAPSWSRTLERTAQIGAHVFYRQAVRLSSN